MIDIRRKEINFSQNKDLKSSHIILNKGEKNILSPAVGDSVGIYLIYFNDSIIYIGRSTNRKISYRLGEHFRIGNGDIHIQKHVTNSNKITKIEHNKFYDLMTEEGKIVIYYFTLKDIEIYSGLEEKIVKFESFCINYINPKCNKLMKNIEFPAEWFKLFISEE